MISCANTEIDYNRRVKAANNGKVIHAAFQQKAPNFGRGSNTYITVMCCDHSVTTNHGNWKNIYIVEVDPTSEITCKRCLKIIGAFKTKQLPLLYALKEKESGYYAGPNVSGAIKWVEDLREAVLYRTIAPAKTRGERGVYYLRDIPTKWLTHDEYRDLVSHADKWRYNYKHVFDSKRYEIVAVRLSEEYPVSVE